MWLRMTCKAPWNSCTLPRASKKSPESNERKRCSPAFQSLALMEPVRQDDMKRFQRPVEEHLAKLAASSGAEIIWPADFLCHDGVCPPLDQEGNFMYIDSHHLRASFAAKQATFIDDVLRPSAGAN